MPLPHVSTAMELEVKAAEEDGAAEDDGAADEAAAAVDVPPSEVDGEVPDEDVELPETAEEDGAAVAEEPMVTDEEETTAPLLERLPDEPVEDVLPADDVVPRLLLVTAEDVPPAALLAPDNAPELVPEAAPPDEEEPVEVSSTGVGQAQSSGAHKTTHQPRKVMVMAQWCRKRLGLPMGPVQDGAPSH